MKRLMLMGAAVLTTLVANAADAATTFVGSYQVDQGAYWETNPQVYSAAEAAALLFGGLASDYDISTAGSSIAAINHLGWYSTWGIGGGQQYNQSYKLDQGAPGYNSPGGTGSAISAYVRDNASGAQYTNYVFRVTADAAVPEPATWSMMLLGFGALGYMVRRRRQIESSVRVA